MENGMRYKNGADKESKLQEEPGYLCFYNTEYTYMYRILHEWSLHMKFMKRAIVAFHKFHMK